MKSKKGIPWIIGATVGVLCCMTCTLPAQVIGTQHAEPEWEQDERPHAAYLPNAYQNQRRSLGYRASNVATSKTTSSTITTVQVNVDAQGMNVIGDAGNEPSIAVNPFNSNEIVIGWRQFDNVNSDFRQAGRNYSSDGGQTWGAKSVFEPGVFRSDPVLEADNAGNFYYNSLGIDSIANFYCTIFKSSDGGVTWDNGTFAEGGDKSWTAIDRTNGGSEGNIYLNWTESTGICHTGQFTRSLDGGASFEQCSAIPGSPRWGTMAMGNAGEVYVSGVGGTQPYLHLFKAPLPGSFLIWDAPIDVFMHGSTSFMVSINPYGLLGQANVDVDHSQGPGRDNIYLLSALARSGGDIGDIMFAGSADGGYTWSVPRQINDDADPSHTQWFGTMSVAPNGRIDAIWLDTRDAAIGSDASALYYAYSIDQGVTWSANEKLSDNFDQHLGYPTGNPKMGDYFDMVSDNGGAHLAWANTFNGEEDIYYSHIVPGVNVGMEASAMTTPFYIFPNPTDGHFAIQGDAKPTRIEIFDAVGTLIQVQHAKRLPSQFDLTTSPPGMYFVKITPPNGIETVRKLIKE